MSQKLTTQFSAGTHNLTPTMNIIEIDTSEGEVILIMPTTADIVKLNSPLKFIMQDVTGNAATNNIIIKPNPSTTETVNNLTEVTLSINNIAATINAIPGLGYFVDPNIVSGGGGSTGYSQFNFNYQDLQPDATQTKFLTIQNVAAGNYTIEFFAEEVTAAQGVDGSTQLILKSPSNGSDFSLGSSGLNVNANRYIISTITLLGVEFSLIKSTSTINNLTAGEWNIFYKITAINS